MIETIATINNEVVETSDTKTKTASTDERRDSDDANRDGGGSVLPETEQIAYYITSKQSNCREKDFLDNDDDDSWPYDDNLPQVFGQEEDSNAQIDNDKKNNKLDKPPPPSSSTRKKLNKYRKAFVKISVDLHDAKEKEEEYKKEINYLRKEVSILHKELRNTLIKMQNLNKQVNSDKATNNITTKATTNAAISTTATSTPTSHIKVTIQKVHYVIIGFHSLYLLGIPHNIFLSLLFATLFIIAYFLVGQLLSAMQQSDNKPPLQTTTTTITTCWRTKGVSEQNLAKTMGIGSKDYYNKYNDNDNDDDEKTTKTTNTTKSKTIQNSKLIGSKKKNKKSSNSNLSGLLLDRKNKKKTKQGNKGPVEI